MKTYARIDGGCVAEIFASDGDITKMFHPSLVWVDITALSPVPQYGWSAQQSGGSWNFSPPAGPTLAQAQQAQAAVLSTACQAKIRGGYNSSALGVPHTYPSGETDQRNQTDAFAASLLPGLPAGWTVLLWCEDALGNWSFAPHTAAQIQQLHADWMIFRGAAQSHYAAQVAACNAATTVAALQAITW